MNRKTLLKFTTGVGITTATLISSLVGCNTVSCSTIHDTVSSNTKDDKNKFILEKVEEGYQKGYDAGYQKGCFDTQGFWNEVDRNSYLNFFVEKVGEDKYLRRSTEDRKETPLEKYLNSQVNDKK